MSTILLAKELGANPVLLDDYRARKLAKAESLEILGSVGLLETFYLRWYLTDLRSAFRQLQRLYRSAAFVASLDCSSRKSFKIKRLRLICISISIT